MADHDADVLIVGLGPVGGVLAGLLAGWGVSVIAVDREAAPHALPRAAHFDHEIMRTFQQLGIAEALLPYTRAVPAYEFRNGAGDILLRFDLRGRDTVSGWQPSFLFHQPAMEQVLRARLAQLPGLELRLATRLLRIEANAHDHVTATLAGPDGREATMRARFLVGADGGASFVRQALGVGLFDYGFERAFLVVDAVMDDESALSVNALQICDPVRPVTVMPMSPGRRRWEFMLRADETAAAVLEEAAVRALLAPIAPLDRMRIVRKAVYVFHGLVAERWRVGSVLLAGDAAHQMPPFMGQGMCSGIRDAANLAWKLALALRGEAAPGLLDSYQAEREPHVRAIVEAAIAMGEVVCVADPVAAAARDADLMARRAAQGDPPGAPPLPDLSGGALTATPWAGTLFPQVAARLAGGRAGRLDDLLGGGAWLITQSPVPDPGLAHLTVVRLGEDLLDDGRIGTWLSDAAAVLVRPDRVVFGTGAPADLLEAWRAALGGTG